MSRAITFICILTILLPLVACGEEGPEIEWELTVDGDVDQTVTYTYQELVEMRRATLTDIVTQDPENPDERTSWEGVTLYLLLREAGEVEHEIQWWVLITLADGTSHRMSLADLRGAIIAFKDGQGNWLADTDTAPIRLIAPSRPSSEWLVGPVRITVDRP